jgi:hypothetical protein
MNIEKELKKNNKLLEIYKNKYEIFLQKSNNPYFSYQIDEFKKIRENYFYYYDINIALNRLKISGFPDLTNNFAVDVHGFNREQFSYLLDYLFEEAKKHKDIVVYIITGKGKGILRNFLIENFDEYNSYYGTKFRLKENGEGFLLM